MLSSSWMQCSHSHATWYPRLDFHTWKLQELKQFRMRIRSSGNNSVTVALYIVWQDCFQNFLLCELLIITSNEHEYLCWTSRMWISYWKCSKRHSSTHQENKLVELARIDTESGIETRSIGSKKPPAHTCDLSSKLEWMIVSHTGVPGINNT